ncbi:MAG TPA: hypothetical protein VN753_11395 [Terracidiphilus sp.]|jgi:hypothetical protein|nr:hypothetical protein [Terracidiphilus sp.]
MPTNHTLNIPGHADLQMAIGDTLVISFTSAAKFCVDSGNQNAFSPALPSAQSGAQGTQWPATGSATANAATTITYSHCKTGDNCGQSRNPTAGISGTIKVGTGK